MKHVLSTHLFANHRLSTVWLDRIRPRAHEISEANGSERSSDRETQ